MSEEISLQGNAGQSESNAATLDKRDEVGTVQPPKSPEDMVKWDTYSRAMSKLKQREAEKVQLEQELHKFKEQELLATGKLEDAVELYKSKASSLEQQLQEQQSVFAEKQFQLALNEAALKEGIRAEAVNDLWLNLKDNYYEKVELSDDLDFDQTQIRSIISEYREKKPHWFAQTRTAINDGIPRDFEKTSMSFTEHMAKLNPNERMRLAAMNKKELGEYLVANNIRL